MKIQTAKSPRRQEGFKNAKAIPGELKKILGVLGVMAVDKQLSYVRSYAF